MTVATDWLLAALAVILGVRLRQPPFSLPRCLVAASFLVLAATALLGGSVHGLAPQLAQATRALLWRLIYGGVGVANLLLLAGILAALARGGLRTALLLLLALRFAVFLALARDFGFVMGDLALTLLLLLGLGLFFTLVRRRAFAPWLLLGVVVSMVGAFVQTQRLAPHPLFNHNDLFHVIQMGGVYLLYRAAQQLPSGTLTPEREAD
jgi:hypothetical protein